MRPTIRSVLCLIFWAMAVVWAHAQGVPGSLAPHPITIGETLALRKPSSVQISPDGTQVAYVVAQPVLKPNEDHSVLYVSSTTSPGTGTPLVEGIHISTVRWFPDGKAILYVLETKAGSQVWRVNADSRQKEQLTEIKGQLAQFWEPTFPDAYTPYAVSPDGTRIVYATYDKDTAKREQEAEAKGGFVYRGGFVQALTDLTFRWMPFELWVYDSHQGRTKKIWTTPTFSRPGGAIPEFAWAPDGRTLALLYQTSAAWQYTLALLDTVGGTVKRLPKTLSFGYRLKWSDDGRSLTFVSLGEYEPGNLYSRDVGHYTFSIADFSLKRDEEATLAALLGQDAVAKAVEQKTGDLLHHCSLNSNNTRAACIRESPMAPPEVVAVALNHGAPEGKPLVLTHLNPEYDAIQLGQISPLSWSDKKGAAGQAQAGLILPVNYLPGKHYPLAVMLYNLYNGKQFIADTDFTSYPAQTFAGRGYAVLLMNLPSETFVYKEGDFEAAKAAEVDGVVSAVRSAVDLLVARGIADPKRMGIMGWSYGAFYTNYIVTHYPDWFQAAASGEGGNHDPGEYWRENDVWREQERRFYGCGPYGKCYARWKEISPVLNVDRLKAPLLLEYGGSGYPHGLEMHTAILEQGGQTELVIYADDQHVFFRPLNRYNSMMRHYDWFNFWLLGQEDPNPAKAEQYARWRELHKQHEENLKKLADAPKNQ